MVTVDDDDASVKAVICVRCFALPILCTHTQKHIYPLTED